MYSPYGRGNISVLPDDLIAFAWSAPMRDLAARIGISDVGLRKLLVSHGVVLPPQGHWNRVHAGRSVPNPPKAQPRRPGETGRDNLDMRFAGHIAEAAPMSSSGPFATAAVPEDLEVLRSQELTAIGRPRVPKTLDAPHPGLQELIAKEGRRRQKDREISWNWDKPRFDNPLDQRKLRIINALFLVLAKRGHHGDVSHDDHEFSARAVIGNTYLGLAFEIIGKHRKVVERGYYRLDPSLPASTPLILQVRPRFDQEVSDVWQDDAEGQLEAKIAEIAAGLIVTGEVSFRTRLRLDEEEAERKRLEREAKAERDRLERERRRIEKLHQLNVQRIADLQRSGELLRLSQDIRALVIQVRGAMHGRSDVVWAELEAWEGWALAEADKLDPVLSGQVLSHLHPPVLEEED